MKRIYQFICAFCLVCGFTACNDLLDTNPDNIINDDEYIDKEDEIYKGMLGILNRMQEAGDQAIWLTDTRSNFLEVTDKAPDALKAIYNYDPTNGNEFADPTCYYAIIIACNDYFAKMTEYHKKVGGMSETVEAHFSQLISSAIRIKVWAYWMLGKIYGQAYWFDDPLTDMKDLSDTNIFTKCDMQQLTEKCIQLLDQGMNIDNIHVNANLDMKWYEWLDAETQNQSANIRWQYLAPPYILLRAELVSWRCNYESEEAAQADWQWIRDALLQCMYYYHTAASASSTSYQGLPLPGIDFGTDPNGSTADWNYQQSILQCSLDFGSGIRDQYFPYFSIFANEEVNSNTNKYHFISGIMYDYTNRQRNHLVQYLCPEYPSEDSYYLRPSKYGQGIYATSDIRGPEQGFVTHNLGGKECVTKYYYYYDRTSHNFRYLRENIFEIQPIVITFRGHDLHFLLAEAENHLGNWDQAETILNNGMTNRFPNHDKENFSLPQGWSPYYLSWLPSNGFNPLPNSGGNTNAGIVGAARGKAYNLPKPTDPGYSLTEAQRKEIYDWAIADEHLKEYVAEGKSYSYLCKMAERYSNAGRGEQSAARDSVIKRIAPKYPSSAAQQRVRSSISGNGYFIQWDLKD